MQVTARLLLLSLVCGAWWSPAWSVSTTRDFLPQDGSQVVQVLAPRAKKLSSTPAVEEVALSARSLIDQSRRLSDPRFLGRAQAILAPWWNRVDAPESLAILQATIEQSRHHFEAARNTLQRILKANPRHAQALITLATLERLGGHYSEAMKVCEQLAASAAAQYAGACRLETASLLGEHTQAKAGFQRLIEMESNRATRAWLTSLAAENLERAGGDVEAQSMYGASLELDADPYTALALSDLHLRNGQAALAIKSLRGQPESDAVLIRRASALAQLGESAQANRIKQELEERFRAMQVRGEDARLHGREFALYALWIESNPAKALAIAQSSLAIQKEPLDWWVYASSARALGDPAEIERAKQLFRASGLVDHRVSQQLARSSKGARS